MSEEKKNTNEGLNSMGRPYSKKQRKAMKQARAFTNRGMSASKNGATLRTGKRGTAR